MTDMIYVALSQIDRDRYQIRDALDQARVEEYADIFDRLPPIVVQALPEGRFAVLDGFHRLAAATRNALTEIATVEAGSAGLAGGTTKPSDAQKPAEEPKKKGFGLSGLIKPAGTEKKSAEVTGSAASRGVDTERNAKGGPVKTMVAVKLTPADVDALVNYYASYK